MEESILRTIKKMLGGGTETSTHFDTEIITHINSALMILTQLGVGPKDGFAIKDDSAIWSDFLKSERNFEAAKTYVYLRVRLLFDPPTTSAVIDAMNQTISELDFRLQVQSDE